MSTVSRDLGSVTAYASAVEGGYGGSYDQFCADMASISESSGMIPGIIGAIPIESASGDIVAFDDGAGDAPVHKLNIELNPKQDFNGYDYAWAGGCGKNILPNTATTQTVNGITFTVNSDKSITARGTSSARTDFVVGTMAVGTIAQGTQYCINGCVGGSSTTYAFWLRGHGTVQTELSYDGDGIFAGNAIDASINRDAVITIFNGVSVNTTFYPMIRLASETDDTYEPYENICPISGYTGVAVTRTGKNLLPPLRSATVTTNGITLTNNNGVYTLTGTATANATFSSIPFIGLLPMNCQYTLQAFNAVANNSVNLFLITESGTRNPQISLSTTNAVLTTAAVTQRIRMVRIMVRSGAILSNFTLSPVVTYGADGVTEFVPYAGGATYPVTFPTEAGTVYGGTIDVSDDGSGILTVTKGYWKPTSSTGTGTMSQSANGNRCGFACDFTIQGNTANILCSCGTPDSYVNSGNNSKWVVGHCALYKGSPETYFRFVFPTTITTAADGLQFLIDNDCEVVYDLTNPIIYSLTAPQVKTLLGNNVMWADSGAISVDYRANIGMYFEKRENKTRQIIAGVETTDKATQNYYAGDMMIVGDSLCIATTAISSGATFVVGSNIIETTVAEQLLLLSNL